MFLEKGAIKQEEEFEEYIKAFYKRKYSSGFAEEMNRSAARYLEHFRT
jgi:hypothetical protein